MDAVLELLDGALLGLEEYWDGMCEMIASSNA